MTVGITSINWIIASLAVNLLASENRCLYIMCLKTMNIAAIVFWCSCWTYEFPLKVPITWKTAISCVSSIGDESMSLKDALITSFNLFHANWATGHDHIRWVVCSGCWLQRVHKSVVLGSTLFCFTLVHRVRKKFEHWSSVYQDWVETYKVVLSFFNIFWL